MSLLSNTSNLNKSLTKEAILLVEGFEKIPEDGSKYLHGKIKYVKCHYFKL
jgi:hypothetical protein